jgi:hypothetical protein
MDDQFGAMDRAECIIRAIPIIYIKNDSALWGVRKGENCTGWKAKLN